MHQFYPCALCNTTGSECPKGRFTLRETPPVQPSAHPPMPRHPLPNAERSLPPPQAEYGVSVFFGCDEGPDDKDSEWTLPQLCQAGLGLPDRDYYFDQDKVSRLPFALFHVCSLTERRSASLSFHAPSYNCYAQPKNSPTHPETDQRKNNPK
jgi:hypothetical protein